MAAGMSRKQRNSRVYNRLKTLQHTLESSGVHTVYRRLQLFAETTGLTHHNGFNVHYSWSSASNGESFGSAIVTISQDGVSEYYGWQQANGPYDAGVARIIELFSRLAPEQRAVNEYAREAGITEFYNLEHDITVQFHSNGTEFVVIGDSDKVSDATILALSKDNPPAGWVRSIAL
jgi:hypothetical protein